MIFVHLGFVWLLAAISTSTAELLQSSFYTDSMAIAEIDCGPTCTLLGACLHPTNDTIIYVTKQHAVVEYWLGDGADSLLQTDMWGGTTMRGRCTLLSLPSSLPPSLSRSALPSLPPLHNCHTVHTLYTLYSVYRVCIL